MAKEIERKFLVANDDWRNKAEGETFKQGYLSTSAERSVRIRIKSDSAFLTIKGETKGFTRNEFEYAIPLDDAEQLLNMCLQPVINKIRYTINHDGNTWEIDEFFGENKGLILAELELESEDETFSKPSWTGKEVTGDPRYYNASLVQNPFSKW